MTPHILSTIPPKVLLRNLILLYVLYQLYICLKVIFTFVHKNFLLSEINLNERYGRKTWICIMGGSDEQGKQFALQFAKRGFNIFIVGNDRIKNIHEVVNEYYPDVKIKILEKDFNNAYELDFFDDIKDIVDDISFILRPNDVIGTSYESQNRYFQLYYK